jgi:hypothetical protein
LTILLYLTNRADENQLVYLKLKGIDPENHEVTKQLVRLHAHLMKQIVPSWCVVKERIKKYYAKIRQVEQPEEQRPNTVDKAAAKRFVTAAIPKSQRMGNADLPSTSAAGLRAQQVRSTLGRDKYEEEEDSLERVGMARRMRFIAKEGAGMHGAGGDGAVEEGLDFVMGDDGLIGEGDKEEEEEQEEEDAEEDDEEEEVRRSLGEDLNQSREGEVGSEHVDAFLKEMEGELESEPYIQPVSHTDLEGRSKRKRAEDLS